MISDFEVEEGRKISPICNYLISIIVLDFALQCNKKGEKKCYKKKKKRNSQSRVMVVV